MPALVVTTSGADGDAGAAAGGASSVRLHPARSRNAKAKAQMSAAGLRTRRARDAAARLDARRARRVERPAAQRVK